MSFDGLKKWFGEKPEKNKDGDVINILADLYAKNPDDRQKLLDYLKIAIYSIYYETTIGTGNRDLLIEVMKCLLSNDDTNIILAKLDAQQQLGEFEFISVDERNLEEYRQKTGVFVSIWQIDSNGDEFPAYILFKKQYGRVAITYLSVNQTEIQNIDRIFRSFPPSFVKNTSEELCDYAYHMSGSLIRDAKGSCEQSKISVEFIRNIFCRDNDIIRKLDIAERFIGWGKVHGCEDLLLEAFQLAPSNKKYASGIAFSLFLTGKSTVNHATRAIEIIDSIHPWAGVWLLKFIAKSKHPQLHDFYIKCLHDNVLAKAAIPALGRLGNQAAVPYLKPFLTCGNAELSKAALKALSKLLPPDQLPPPPAKPDELSVMEDKCRNKLSKVVHAGENPVAVLSKMLGTELAEFSTSMDAGWFVPTLRKIETAGIPGRWGAIGEYLAGEFEKLRDGACKAWTLQADAITFYIVLEREESDTLSVWICSADKDTMENLNAAAIAQIEICEAESMEGTDL